MMVYYFNIVLVECGFYGVEGVVFCMIISDVVFVCVVVDFVYGYLVLEID